MKVLSLSILLSFICLTGCKKVHNITLQAKISNLSSTTNLTFYIADGIGDGILQDVNVTTDKSYNFGAVTGDKLTINTDFENQNKGFIQGTITIFEGSKQLIAINATSGTQTFNVPQ